MSVQPTPAGGPAWLSSHFSLGCIVAYAKQSSQGAQSGFYSFDPITPRSVADTIEYLNTFDDATPRVFLFSSYVWNHAENMRVAKAARERCAGALIVVGGPEVPRGQMEAVRFLHENPFVDVLARGEGEVQLAELLDEAMNQDAPRLRNLDFSNVPGFTFRDSRGRVRAAPPRERTTALETFPSPYITGEFAHWIDRFGGAPMMLETNRGCPFSCTFCDWGAATHSKIHRFSMDRICSEIEYAGIHRIDCVGFIDANFGILKRDLEIARHCVRMRHKYGYPKRVGFNNTKTASPQFLEILDLLHSEKMLLVAQISVQSTDRDVLRAVERENIKTEQLDRMFTFLNQRAIPVQSELMIGLPGQDVESFLRDLQFLIDRRVTASIYVTQVMPNAPMALPEYRARHGIEVAEDSTVQATASASRDDMLRMFDLAVCYRFFFSAGIGKILLYFMQNDHSVPASRFIETWERVSRQPAEYPLSERVRRDLITTKGSPFPGFPSPIWTALRADFLFQDFRHFCEELLCVYENEFDVRLEPSEKDTVVAAQVAALAARSGDANVPRQLHHDVERYLDDVRRRGMMADTSATPRLRDYPPGNLTPFEVGRGASYAYVGKTLERNPRLRVD